MLQLELAEKRMRSAPHCRCACNDSLSPLPVQICVASFICSAQRCFSYAEHHVSGENTCPLPGYCYISSIM